jgi:tyrosinase
MGQRKNQTTLTNTEKTALVNAFLALKNSVPSRMGLSNRYDDYVQMHQDSMNAGTMTGPGWAHNGPAFLPWHREYLRRFELDLQTVDASVTLPYWDWTVDNSPGAALWQPDFLGGNGRAGDRRVTDGPFAYGQGRWTIHVNDPDIPNPGPALRRNFGGFPGAGLLPTPIQVNNALAEVPYYVSPWRSHVDFANRQQPVLPSFCNRLEGWYGDGSIHNRVHLWVAGGTPPGFTDAGDMFWGTSPNDPAFWLHHANIDRLWAKWGTMHASEPYHPSGSGLELGPAGHNLHDPMRPWNEKTPADVLDHRALGYSYDTDPPPVHADHAGGKRHHFPMFDLSPEDKAASRPHRKPAFDLSPEDKVRAGG